MKRTFLNMLVDAIAAAVMLGMIGTGIIMRFTLPPGSGRIASLWGMTRHQWGDLHFWLSVAAIAVVVLHLSLHWTWVVTVVRRWLARSSQGAPTPRTRAIAAIATFLIAALAMGGFWWTSLRFVEQATTSSTEAAPDPEGVLRGNMSVTQAAAALGCSVEEVRRRLELPASVADTEHLGQIARQRGKTMRELRSLLERVGTTSKP